MTKAKSLNYENRKHSASFMHLGDSILNSSQALGKEFHNQGGKSQQTQIFFPIDVSCALTSLTSSKFFWYSIHFLSAWLFASHLVSISWQNMYHHHWRQRLCWFGEESIGPKYHGWDGCAAMKHGVYKINNSPTAISWHVSIANKVS